MLHVRTARGSGRLSIAQSRGTATAGHPYKAE